MALKQRPRTRIDCAGEDGIRPCPWVSCRYNLFLDVTTAGNIKLNFPDRDLEDIEDSCALDVAEAAPDGGLTLEQVAARMNLTRERVRQIEARALLKIKGSGKRLPVLDGDD